MYSSVLKIFKGMYLYVLLYVCMYVVMYYVYQLSFFLQNIKLTLYQAVFSDKFTRDTFLPG